MKVYVLLADKGKTNPQAGTLDLLNAGWIVTGYGSMTPVGRATHPQAVAIFYEVGLSRCNKDLVLVVELLTEDGQQVTFPQPPGGSPAPPRGCRRRSGSQAQEACRPGSQVRAIPSSSSCLGRSCRQARTSGG